MSTTDLVHSTEAEATSGPVKVLIVGVGSAALALAHRIEVRRHCLVVGFAADDERFCPVDWPVLGKQADASTIARKYKIDEICIVDQRGRDQQPLWQPAIPEYAGNDVPVSLPPSADGFPEIPSSLKRGFALPAAIARRIRGRLLKPICDASVNVIALVLLVPLSTIVCTALVLTSRMDR